MEWKPFRRDMKWSYPTEIINESPMADVRE